MKKMLLFLLTATLMSCNTIAPEHDPISYGELYVPNLLSTDNARYLPGQTVSFILPQLIEGATVTYYHFDEVMTQHPLSSTSWQWTPPTEDYQGYLVTISVGDSVYSAIGVDVSSEPAKFVRNGFLSSYGNLSSSEVEKVMANLNRYHINYVQFQDWHWKHHHPLAGTPDAPMTVWTDIISRDTYMATLKAYIASAHNKQMKTLFYNLIYGALSDAAKDGIQEEWYLFKDKTHTEKDVHPLSAPFKSSIYLVNPGNPNWIDFLTARNNDVYEVFDFDGWQIDQLGDRGSVYDYSGTSVNLAQGFVSMIEANKQAQPDKSIVMNAVGQYAQQGYIATSDVDFLYTEVWDKSVHNGYEILANIITNNDAWSAGKSTVLAAYMDYDFGIKGRAFFNTPGVLMTTAVASAWGGTILQLGEHMLCNEYFPKNDLEMHGELKRALIDYYDFAVAYENLLRDGGTWYGVDIVSEATDIAFNQWPPVKNQIATVGKEQQGRDIIHLLSYRNATHLDWADTDATQTEPDRLTNVTVRVPTKGEPARVYAASPDYRHGQAIALDYNYAAGSLTLTIPSIKYWTMLVIEY